MDDLNARSFIAATDNMRKRMARAFDSCKIPIAEMATLSGYSPTQIRRFKAGHFKDITLENIWQLAKALRVNPYWLVGAPRVSQYEYVEDFKERRVTFISEIIDGVSAKFMVHKRDILSRCKFDFILPARFALCKVLRDRGMSYAQIGRIMDRDHTTVIHAVQRAEYMMERDPNYAKSIQELVDMKITPVKLEEVEYV